MMELKGYFTASMNHLQILPLITQNGPRLEKPILALESGFSMEDWDDEILTFAAGKEIEVKETIKYPSFALAIGTQGVMKTMDSFGTIVVEWKDPKIGTKGILKRDMCKLQTKRDSRP